MSNLNSEILIFTYSFKSSFMFSLYFVSLCGVWFCFFLEICIKRFWNEHTVVYLKFLWKTIDKFFKSMNFFVFKIKYEQSFDTANINLVLRTCLYFVVYLYPFYYYNLEFLAFTRTDFGIKPNVLTDLNSISKSFFLWL